jgi:hypothetical protein
MMVLVQAVTHNVAHHPTNKPNQTLQKHSELEVAVQAEKEAVAGAQAASKRAEASLQRLTQKYGTVDLDEYNRLKAEAVQMKVGGTSVVVLTGVRRQAATHKRLC